MSTPRIRIATFNTHWGGTHSNLSSLKEFVKSALNAPNHCGVLDEDFEDSVVRVSRDADVLCLQEFPLKYDKEAQAYVPNISSADLLDNFDFFCSRILNTSVWEQSNIPPPLRATNQNIGLVTAVRKNFRGEHLYDFFPPPQPDDRSRERSFPIVKIVEPKSDRELIVINIYGQSPEIKTRFNGAKSNLNSLLKHVDRSSSLSGAPIVLAGDFNISYRMLIGLLRSHGHNGSTRAANVGATFPTMIIPQKLLDDFETQRTYKAGFQFDHIVAMNGAKILNARSLSNLSNSDHLPVIADINLSRERNVSKPNTTRDFGRHLNSR